MCVVVVARSTYKCVVPGTLHTSVPTPPRGGTRHLVSHRAHENGRRATSLCCTQHHPPPPHPTLPRRPRPCLPVGPTFVDLPHHAYRPWIHQESSCDVTTSMLLQPATFSQLRGCMRFDLGSCSFCNRRVASDALHRICWHRLPDSCFMAATWFVVMLLCSSS